MEWNFSLALQKREPYEFLGNKDAVAHSGLSGNQTQPALLSNSLSRTPINQAEMVT